MCQYVHEGPISQKSATYWYASVNHNKVDYFSIQQIPVEVIYIHCIYNGTQWVVADIALPLASVRQICWAAPVT